MLPRENENRAEMERSFGRLFAAARGVIDLSIQLTGAIGDSAAEHPHGQVCYSIMQAATRRLYSIMRLVEIAHTQDAQILNRSLFSLSLQSYFVTRVPVLPDACSAQLRAEFEILNGFLDTDGVPIWRRTVRRCFIYQNRDALSLFETARRDPTQDQATIEAELNEFRTLTAQTIGDEWADRLMRHQYLGFSQERLLAEYSRRLDYYTSAYRVDSGPIHGGGAIQLDVGHNRNRITGLICLAVQSVGGMMYDMDGAFELGHSQVISNAAEEFDRQMQSA